MRKYYLNIIRIGSIFMLGLILSSARNKKYESLPVHVTFGVKIGLLPTGQLTQYALVYYRDHKLINITPIDLQRLVNIGMGKWPIPNSSLFYNYFEKFNVTNDTLPDGTIVPFQAAFDSLWKVQFPINPYNHRMGLGWSRGNTRPSLKQQAYLYDRYGVRGYDQDYYCDTSFFKLIKDVMTPEWVAHYKSLK